MQNKSKTIDVIWTDRDQTASIIWRAYTEHLEKFEEYILNINIGLDNPLSQAAVYRKASAFYYETQDFYDNFKSELSVKDVLKVRALFKSMRNLSADNHFFLRTFFSKFMVVSGIRNIVMTKSTANNIDKFNSRYGITETQIESEE